MFDRWLNETLDAGPYVICGADQFSEHQMVCRHVEDECEGERED
jgi:hypothetical protein